MTKSKSKQIKKAKYLLLLPLLVSMLIYTSCETNQVEEILQQKQFQTSYFSAEGEEMKVTKSEKETYLDYYMGVKIPDWKEISFSDLSEKEKLEITSNNIYNFLNTKEGLDLKFYELESGRRVTGVIIDFWNMSKKDIVNNDSNSIPLSIIEEVPVFPGCEGTKIEKKNCLNESIKKLFLDKFDVNISKNLGLSKGKKKIYVIFKIDKNGNVVDVNARAPHPKLKEEVIKIANLLPKMKAGKQRGKAVGVRYTLPISFNVE